MCMKKKLHVRPLSKRSEAAQLGRSLLNGKAEATVTYRQKTWPVKDLIRHLADRVQTLERSQCRPCVRCLFEGQKYLEEKYIGNNDYAGFVPYEAM